MGLAVGEGARLWEARQRANTGWAVRGVCGPANVIHHAYLRWLRTQRYEPENGPKIGMDGWLIGVKDFWVRRAPSNTCLSALIASTEFGERALNNSKGCGGIMRVAPVGLLAVDP